MAEKSRKFLFTLLYTIYALDLVGLVFVFVVFSPLILDPTSTIVAAATTPQARNLIIGFLFATYPLTQLVGAPILGELSDRFGRRRVLIFATAGTGIATLLSGLAIDLNSLWLLFASRLFAGFLAGNLTVAMAAVADNTSDEERGRYVAAFSIFAGLGWTIGPYLGAVISQISYAAPFWSLGVLFVALASFVLWAYPVGAQPEAEPRLNLKQAFSNLFAVFKNREATFILAIYFFQLASWALFQTYLAPWTIQRFDFTETWESIAYAVSSFFWMIGGLVGSRWLLKHYSPKKVAIIPGIGACLSVFALVLIPHSGGIWPALAVGNFCEALFFSCMVTLASLVVSSDMQGKMMGTINAGLALSLLIGPLLAGWLVSVWINLPFLIASIGMLIMAITYIVWYFRSRLTP